MLTIFEELVSVAICSRSNLRSTGLSGVWSPLDVVFHFKIDNSFENLIKIKCAKPRFYIRNLT